MSQVLHTGHDSRVPHQPPYGVIVKGAAGAGRRRRGPSGGRGGGAARPAAARGRTSRLLRNLPRPAARSKSKTAKPGLNL